MSSRNFTNKLWNAGKFILYNLEQLEDSEWQGLAHADFRGSDSLEGLPLAERWVVSALHQVTTPCCMIRWPGCHVRCQSDNMHAARDGLSVHCIR